MECLQTLLDSSTTPALAVGVVAAGFLLGSTHDDTVIAGIIPNSWIEWAVGGNSLLSNFFASFTGAFMYFATLTEVPIVQGLLASGMGKGPALALLLAGPSLSLPNMLVIRGVLGTNAGHPRCFGHEENSRLCRTCNCHGDNFRLCVWEFLLIIAVLIRFYFVGIYVCSAQEAEQTFSFSWLLLLFSSLLKYHQLIFDKLLCHG